MLHLRVLMHTDRGVRSRRLVVEASRDNNPELILEAARTAAMLALGAPRRDPLEIINRALAPYGTRAELKES